MSMKSQDDDKKILVWNVTYIDNELYFVGTSGYNYLTIYVYSPHHGMVSALFDEGLLTKEHNEHEYRDIFALLHEHTNHISYRLDGEKLRISINLKNSSPMKIELSTKVPEISEQNEVLKALSLWQMKGMVVLNSMNQDLEKLLVEKDSAIEFLGHTAKEYGGTSLIRRWAPVGSRNYDSLTKFRSSRWRELWLDKFSWDSGGYIAEPLLQNIQVVNSVEPIKPGTKNDIYNNVSSNENENEFVEKVEEPDSFLAELATAEMSLK